MRFIKFLWRALNTLRKLFFNLVFIFIIVLLISAFIPQAREPIPDSTVLWISPKGVLVDEKTFDPSLADILETEPQENETSVRDLTRSINAAALDDRITAIVLNVKNLTGGGTTKILEVGRAIETFKANGKEVIAYSDFYDQQQYLLASFANTILINDLGSVFITGFGSYREYIYEATQKLKLDFHIFKVGTYKDAVEPLIRNSMSEASKEHNSQWVGELWDSYTTQIEQLRNLDEGAIEAYVRAQSTTFPASFLTSAQFAKEAKLVDEVMSRIELRQYFINRFGVSEKTDQPKGIGLERYLAELTPNPIIEQKNIGLIIAQGTILDGNQPAGTIGGESLSQLIRDAGNDETLKALVIKIDSGGGSAFASEVIRQEIVALRNRGLPVYISMGSVAASGGYWIAAGADKIWAMPTTITGSIGVWGVYPNLSKTFESLGIYTDGVGTTELSSTFVPTIALPKPAEKIFQAGVDNIYQQFLTLVAQARGMTTTQVNEIAQGRVWTGTKALELGLVDALGSTEDTIAAVAKDNNIQNYQVKRLMPQLTFKEQILQALMQQSKVASQKIQSMVLGDTHALISHTIEQSSLSSIYQKVAITSKEKKLSVIAQCLECTDQ